MVWEEPMVTNTDKSFESDSFKELQLLQSWFSPSFPIGSYSYSHGLESLIEEKIIQNKSDVIEYLTGIIFNGTCKNDIIFIPPYWWYSIKCNTKSCVLVYKYRTFMNNVTIIPKLLYSYIAIHNKKNPLEMKKHKKQKINNKDIGNN